MRNHGDAGSGNPAVRKLLVCLLAGLACACKPAGDHGEAGYGHHADAAGEGVALAGGLPHRQNVSPLLADSDRVPEQIADAMRWGLDIRSEAFRLVEDTKYRAEHGQINPPGAPLAGGGVVGKDDWRSVVNAAHGLPSAAEYARKRAREKLFFAEMPKRDPVADAKAAAAHGDWRLFMGTWEKQVPSDLVAVPLHFAAWGLEDVFGCGLTEAQFRANARRTWFDYYDVQYPYTIYVAGKMQDGRMTAFGVLGNIDEFLLNHNNSSRLYWNTNKNDYHAIYNRTLYAISLSMKHVFPLNKHPNGICMRDFSPI